MEINLNNNNPFTLIAGPCLIESRELCLEVVEELLGISKELGIPYIFKGSFDKANRSSIYSERGLGLEKGLEILKEIKFRYGVPVTTDIHEPYQADFVAEIVDIIQIPAYLCRQTDLLVAAAKTGKFINVKKGQFIAPNDVGNIISKIEESGNSNIAICERGSTFGYNNLVVDMAGLVEMKKYNKPIIFDGTHSVQKPGGNGISSGGNREYVEFLSRAAVSIGVSGVFLETHPNPNLALSDGPNMVPINEMKELLRRLKTIDDVVKGFNV